MPLYDYQCQQCSSGFTELRRTTEMDASIDCPECGSRDTQRTLSSFAVGGSSSSIPSAAAPAQSPFS
ncbi:MAG: zinc ribbon domain-containing protein [SAR324 cluster bacterium]|nr:zinc ribbon domain-containing protein [SAR324 cluster bacterium]